MGRVSTEMRQAAHGSYYFGETMDWHAAPMPGHPWTTGSYSGNIKTQWRAQERRLSNEKVKCLEPRG